jgi:CRISPR/Cas system CSM-associated protein Csm3 (group 7 of RAMP superfamily)
MVQQEKKQDCLEKESCHLTGKLFIKADFILKSSLIIGSGETEQTDIDVIRDDPYPEPRAALLPASSVIGVFRHLFDPFLIKSNTDLVEAYYEFFGCIEDESNKLLKELRKEHQSNKKWDVNQSALLMSDILLTGLNISQRDGVRIDPRTGTAVDGAKFDYEIVEPDKEKSFSMLFEINLRAPSKKYKDYFKGFVGNFLKEIDAGHVRFGAKTNKGFGVFALVENSVQIADLDFENAETNKTDIRTWLKNDLHDRYKNVSLNELCEKKLPELSKRVFKILAEFRIKNSLLIRSYSTEPKDPDVSSIQRGKDYILPGPSLMGAIRHRAWKIINTMIPTDKEKRFYELFGFVATDSYPELPEALKTKFEQKAAKGRLQVNESIIEKHGSSILEQVQTRIKIDRFTGGTMTGALLQENVLWQTDKETTLKLEMRLLDYQDWEAGLLLFILKDLVTGDLAIGGEKAIGRGVLIGHSATITWPERQDPVQLKFDEGFIEDETQLESLLKFQEAWQKELNHQSEKKI